MREISASTFRKELNQLLEGDEPVAITKYGKIIARLFPAMPGEEVVGHIPPPYTTESRYDSADFAPAWVAEERLKVQAAQKRRDDLLRGINSAKTRK